MSSYINSLISSKGNLTQIFTIIDVHLYLFIFELKVATFFWRPPVIKDKLQFTPQATWGQPVARVIPVPIVATECWFSLQHVMKSSHRFLSYLSKRPCVASVANAVGFVFVWIKDTIDTILDFMFSYFELDVIWKLKAIEHFDFITIERRSLVPPLAIWRFSAIRHLKGSSFILPL